MSTFTQQITTVRGRGARTDATGRFESATREAFDDGWTPDDVEPTRLTTTVTAEKARVIITRNDSPDVGFSASINPYRGCEHGCIYCAVTQLRCQFPRRGRVPGAAQIRTCSALAYRGRQQGLQARPWSRPAREPRPSP